RPDDLLAGGTAGVAWDTVDFHQRNRLARRSDMRWTASSAIEVHGLCVWWSATLADGITLSTSPLCEATHWEQLFFPALEPVKVSKGETLVATLRSRSSEEAGTDMAWSLAVETSAGKVRAKQALSLDKGFIP
ncbi:MAG: ribonucleotide-diphosphate reductase subunit beta, partial [Hyphomicrobiaceae bacterium]